MNAEPDLRTWDAWLHKHQQFELQWWREALEHGHSCDDNGFTQQWRDVKEFIQPHGVVLDIGCGPRPPFAPCIVIEPLAEKYQEITPAEWWDRVGVYAQPAEDLIDDLRQAVDTVICWNCLDHAIGWKAILDNMLAYARSSRSRIAVATDFFPPFLGHPGFERDDFEAEIARRFKIIERREPFGRALALLMEPSDAR